MHRFFLLFLLGSSLVHGTLTTLPNSLETLTIQESGRRKPYFVFAEETLRFLSGKTALIFEGRKEEASEIITSFWLEPDKKYTQEPLIYISFAPLKKILGLPLEQSLFSYEKLIHHPGLQEMIAQAMEERKNDPRKRLQGNLKEAADIGMRLSLFEELKKGSIFRIVPNAQVRGGRWGTLSEWEESDASSNVAMAQNAFSLMQQGWKNANSAIFNQGVLQLREALSLFSRADTLPFWKLQLEVLLQKIHPFRWSWILYALAGLLMLFFQ